MISYLGRYGGTNLIPPWIDLGVVAVFSLLICALAVQLRLPTQRVAITLAADLNTLLVHPDPETRITPPELLEA